MHAHNQYDAKKNTVIMIAFFIGMIISIAREEFQIALVSGGFVIVFFALSAIQKATEHTVPETIAHNQAE